MADGTGRGILVKKFLFFVTAIAAIGTVGYLAYMKQQYCVQQETGYTNVMDAARELTGELGQMVKNTDEGTVNEIFDFFQQKTEDGAWKSTESMEQAIREGKERFGVELQEEDAQQIVDTVEQLEAIGISPEDMLEEARNLYEEYGAEYVEHAEEAITNAVKTAAADMAESFVDYVTQTIQETVKNIFSGT